jgi:gluconate 2-dehydrogenase gamma chain
MAWSLLIPVQAAWGLAGELQMHEPTKSRRQFLAAGATLANAGWIAANWPSIAMAAEQAGHMHGDAAPAPASLQVLSATEAAEVDAIANQIVPGGARPGARDARVVYFIDRALGSFFAAELAEFRKGLADFQQAYASHSSTTAPFSAAGDARQVAWLHEVETTAFFATVRRLTLLGLVAMPKYGGNHDKAGWKLLGFEDRHVWQPPFGYYDKDYPGFEPYPGTKPYTA